MHGANASDHASAAGTPHTVTPLWEIRPRAPARGKQPLDNLTRAPAGAAAFSAQATCAILG